MAGQSSKESLRKGWTTGACATAAAASAYEALLTGRFPDPVGIILPGGQTPEFALSRSALSGETATAGVIKDAGDDPDVTHGAEIIATVTLAPPGSGIEFRAGDGVGTVTRPGLALDVGEPAINPGPRGMMTTALDALAETHGTSVNGTSVNGTSVHGGSGDVILTISIPGGQALAEKTMNGRLGIIGGLSVLGTTGIVIPYSCSSWIHAIHRGVDVARASGLTHIAAATGSTSESAVQALYGLPETALIDMGDFAGGLLKYLRQHPVDKLSLAGGFAKLTKLAQGHLHLHSSASEVDKDGLARWLGELGADESDCDAARTANTAGEVLSRAQSLNLPLGDFVARRAREVAMATLSGGTALEILVYDRRGRQVGRAGGFDD
ncbi:MAG: cobalt-precorrin-5B (C(1))-methyltransferase [Rhodospirillales bacterium]|nr:cobalt-precorrin-5B (C(1))-methyltransferase [Rhodospirillales bacterium]